MAQPGLRERLYIAGTNVTVFAGGYSPQWMDICVAERLASTALLVERPLEPWDGAPTSILKLSGSIPWERVAEANLPAMEAFASRAGAFDFTDWRPIVEAFSGDGSNKDFALSRRLALTSVPGGMLPVGASTNYATVVTVDGVVDSAVSWGSITADFRLPFTLSLTPADAEENVLVYHVPLYLIRRVGMDKSYPQNNKEGRVFHFEEVA